MKAARLLSRTSATTTTATKRVPSSTRCLHQSHNHKQCSLFLSRRNSSISSLSSQTRIRHNTDPAPHRRIQQQQQRSFYASPYTCKGLQPDSANPSPPQTEPSASSASKAPAAAQISDAEYHELADGYLDRLVYAAEELSERSDSGMDVEYSVRTILHH